MADDTVKVKCKVLRFEDDVEQVLDGEKVLGTTVFIECSIGKRVWIAERWLRYDTPISWEKFVRDFAKTQVVPKAPTDMLAYVKEEADKPFTITVKKEK